MRRPRLSPSKSGHTSSTCNLAPVRPIMGGATVGLRRKGAGIRAWLLIDSTGQAQVMEAGKHPIMRRTGLPARDLRILDPFLSYPSTVLGRERAMVINLEHVKAIITAREVLLLNSRDPSVAPFVEELQRRILRFHLATHPQEGRVNEESEAYDGKQVLDKILPFEFVTLEACLEAVCSSLDNEASTLEQEAHPALDKLTSKISTLNLERVRQIKSRLVAITGRVQKVRDELEHLLDDDEDMAEMYLTDKMDQQILENSTESSINEKDGIDDEVLKSEMDDRIPVEILLEASGGSMNYGDDLQNIDNLQEGLFGAPNVLKRHSSGIRTSTTHSAISKHIDVEELEMLLEAYFVQLDGTLNKLSTLREYVDDTEDYINIMLDDKQNQLLQMGVVLTTATLVVTAFVVLAGIFGMNVRVELFNNKTLGMRNWLLTVGGGTTGTIFLYVVAIAWYKHKRLI